MNNFDILKRKGLSVTEGRMKILDLFKDTSGALAHADIEKQTGAVLDRVTVYRTLQTFVDKGIIHQIPTTDNAVLYALCRHNCNQEHHADNHVHFICNDCAVTVCLDDVMVPEVKLPRGFRPLQSAMVVTGFCRQCRQN
jgi:Fur family ferric uptake transcriptional regulator